MFTLWLFQLFSLLLLCCENFADHWWSASTHNTFWDCVSAHQLFYWSVCVLHHDWSGKAVIIVWKASTDWFSIMFNIIDWGLRCVRWETLLVQQLLLRQTIVPVWITQWSTWPPTISLKMCRTEWKPGTATRGSPKACWVRL